MRWVVGVGAAGSVEGLVACPEGVQLADAESSASDNRRPVGLWRGDRFRLVRFAPGQGAAHDVVEKFVADRVVLEDGPKNGNEWASRSRGWLRQPRLPTGRNLLLAPLPYTIITERRSARVVN